jgi:hypothetical protein
MKLLLRRLGFGLILFASLGIIVALLLFIMRSRPTILALREAGDPRNDPYLSLFNPFRDKSPELKARSILVEMRNGQCDKALSDTRLGMGSGLRNCVNAVVSRIFRTFDESRPDRPGLLALGRSGKARQRYRACPAAKRPL